MLKEISIKNFKSFNDEVLFSMEADVDRVSEFPDHLVKQGENSILKVTSLYGPNGGGKTNLIEAIKFLRRVLNNEDNTLRMPTEYKCLYNDSDIIEETVFFTDDEYEIGYNLQVKADVVHNDNFQLYQPTYYQYVTRFNIVHEEVIYKKHANKEFVELFQRDIDGSLKSELLKKIGIELPLISKSKSMITKLYEEYANNEFSNNEGLIVLRRLYDEINSINELDMFPTQIDVKYVEKYKKTLIKYMNDVDIKIDDIKIYNNNKPDYVYFVRKIKNGNKEIYKEIPLFQESKGTNKIFFIFLRILMSENASKIFVSDDMNSQLHPKLYRAIIEMFNSNKLHSQLIFNTHDMVNMNNTLFRRDEIWFAYRNENYSTQLVPLSNIVNYKGDQVRKDAKYDKQYLEGKYGADPFIKNGLKWFDE